MSEQNPRRNFIKTCIAGLAGIPFVGLLGGNAAGKFDGCTSEPTGITRINIPDECLNTEGLIYVSITIDGAEDWENFAFIPKDTGEGCKLFVNGKLIEDARLMM